MAKAALPANIPWNNLNAPWRHNIMAPISECSLQPAVCYILPQVTALPMDRVFPIKLIMKMPYRLAYNLIL